MKATDIIIVGAVTFGTFVVLKTVLGDLDLWAVGLLGGVSAITGFGVLRITRRRRNS